MKNLIITPTKNDNSIYIAKTKKGEETGFDLDNITKDIQADYLLKTQKPLIEDWLYKHTSLNGKKLTKDDYRIFYNQETNQVEIDISGYYYRTFRIKKSAFKKQKTLPHFIQFNHIDGNFTCKNCELTSLRGCPRSIQGNFDITGNNLYTLINFPTFVGKTIISYHGNEHIKDEEIDYVIDNVLAIPKNEKYAHLKRIFPYIHFCFPDHLYMVARTYGGEIEKTIHIHPYYR